MASLVSEHPSLAAARDASVPPGRARLLDAMARVVAERGYAAARVADVVRAAGVSRSTFYEQFASKEELFLETYRHGVDVLVTRVATAVADAPDWRSELRAGIRSYLSTLADEPVFARAYLLEVHAAGPAVMRRDRFAHLVVDTRGVLRGRAGAARVVGLSGGTGEPAMSVSATRVAADSGMAKPMPPLAPDSE